MSKQKIPSELRPLAEFLDGEGFSLAIPFDNIRTIGYIGGIDEHGKEHIIDDGSCFENHGLKPPPPKKVVLGDFFEDFPLFNQSFAKVFGSQNHSGRVGRYNNERIESLCPQRA